MKTKMPTRKHNAVIFSIRLILISLALSLCFVNTSFAVGVWTYAEATNTVQVTEGTSGTPATFTDFVTADRAGTDTVLLDAGTPASDLALTYAVRPVEDLALKVKCVVANKTAEADFIFITGKDWKGAAQTESIDVTAGNGTYETTEYWSEITTLDCSDNAAGGGNVWADGDLTVTQDIWGVIWDYGSNTYQLNCTFKIGDGGTSTYFTETDKTIILPNGLFSAHYQPFIQINANANLQLGNLDSASDKTVEDPCQIICLELTYADMIFQPRYSANLYLYGLQVNATSRNVYGVYGHGANNSGEYKLYSCVFSNANIYNLTVNGVDIYNCDLHEGQIHTCAGSIENIAVNGVTFPYYFNSGTDQTVENVSILPNWTQEIAFGSLADGDLYARNWSCSWEFTFNAAADGTCYRQYSCDIEVADKDGTLIDGVTVLCEDKDSNDIFEEDTGNTDTGKIDQQWVTYKTYDKSDYGTGGTTLSPHKFTISKAGHRTLVLENITVDGPIDWHLELQAIEMPPAPFFSEYQAADDYYYAEAVNE